MGEKFPVRKAMPVLYKLPSYDMYFTGTSLLQNLINYYSTQAPCHQLRNAESVGC